MYLCVCGTVSSMLSGLASRSLGLHNRHKAVFSLVKVCPSRLSVHHFLALISTKHGVNVTCLRSLQKVHRAWFEPGTLLSET